MLILVVVIITRTYAWYVGYAGVRTDSEDIKMSSMGKYYASGSGTESDPFIITKARHLYNLAWLQDLGYYDEDQDSDSSTDGIQPFYFKLGANIDMSTLSQDGVQSPIPPIGIDSHPFVANFDGAGYAVTNLFVSTEFADDDYIKPSSTVLTSHTETISGGQIVTNYLGFFGYIGSLTKGTELDTEVTNFTIAKAVINTSKNVLAGYVAGYVDNDLSYVGVYYSNFDFSTGVSTIDDYEYISVYGLVGDYNNEDEKISWEDRPTSGGVGYGTSTDLHQLYENLGGTDGESISKLQAFPFRAKSSTLVSPSASTVSVTLASGTKSVSAVTTQEAVDTGNNLGYYVGSDIKLYNKASSVDYSAFYYPNNSSESYELPATINGDTYDAPSDDIVEYLTATQTDDDGNTYRNGDYLMRLTGSAQLDIANESGLYVVENAKVGSWEGNLLVPNRCVWVAPVTAGTFKFVLMNVDSSAMGFRLYKLTRSTPGDYSTYFTTSTYPIEFNALLLSGKAYYFEVEVTEDDIDAGYEYALSAGDGYKPYLSYIDIGVNGDTSASTGKISNIDFVYELSTTTSGYSEVSEDTLSGVGYALEGTSTSQFLLYVYRSQANGVQYVVSGSGITVTAFGNSSTKRDSTSDFS